eukprot:scaffold5709_cov100-Cylindrotheca_fusiformis.AAC.5
MQSTSTSSTSSLSPLASFFKNNLRLSDYDSVQVVADNAKLPQVNGDDDSPVQEHLSPAATKQRRTSRRIKVDRWDNSISQDEEERSLSPPRQAATKQRRSSRRVDRWDNAISQDEEERSLSPVPVRRGGDAMSRRQESLDRYYTEVLADLLDELPPPPFASIEEEESGHPFDVEAGESPSFGPTRKHAEKANKNTLPRPSNEKVSTARAA